MTNHNLVALLAEIKNLNSPVGAFYLSKRLSIPTATIGRMLKAAEDQGYLFSMSNKGRTLTEKGLLFLSHQISLEIKKKAADNLINSSVGIQTDKLIEILYVRKLLEPFAIIDTCKNATDEQIEELENIMFEHMLEIRRGNYGSEQDIRLHLTLAKYSGNATIHNILKLLLAEGSIYTTFASVPDEVMKKQITRHDKIISSLKKRDCAEASLEMENHIELIIDNVRHYSQI